MHVLNYEVKRAHWSLTWWAIAELKEAAKEWRRPELHDMTPARYDILYAIRQRPSWAETFEFQVYQLPFWLLVEKLGLHPSTISRCLDGLIEMGLVTRHIDPRDGRKRIYRLTKLGFDVQMMCHDALFGEGEARYMEANERFATHGAMLPLPPDAPWLGESVTDGILIRFGRRLRQCATELGSAAWPIYDPVFQDPYLMRMVAA